ncbi:MAG: hypothetical protein ACFFAJ_16270 [Candidatus Hodarchaeota archaeon]
MKSERIKLDSSDAFIKAFNRYIQPPENENKNQIPQQDILKTIVDR